MDEQQYTKGFNEGYILMKHRPKLAEAISLAMEKSENPRSFGFIDGGKQYMEETKDKTFDKSQIPKHLDRVLSPDQSRGTGRDKEADKSIDRDERD